MITEITMDKVASFQHATSLNTDKKINLIYGLNGAGKSTISRYFYNQSNPRFANCRLVPQLATKVFVYNSDFIRDNFFVADNLRGIFSLSNENKVAEEKIAKATATLNTLQQGVSNKQEEKRRLRGVFETQKQRATDEIWKIKGTYAGGDRVLEYCLDGLKGQKERLFTYVQAISRPAAEPKKTVSNIREEVEALRDGHAELQSQLPLLVFAAKEVESHPIFGTAIIGNADSEVAGLIERLGNADWVKQGLEYVDQGSNDWDSHCPFCQEDTLSEKLIKDINSYFNDTYQIQIDTLDDLLKTYTRARNDVSNIDAYTDSGFVGGRRADIVKTHRNLLVALDENITSIEDKKKSPKLSQVVKDTSAYFDTLNALVKSINSDISVHNNRLARREEVLQELKDHFWKAMRWQYDQTISRYEKDRDAANQAFKAIDVEIASIEGEISQARAQISDAQKETVNVDAAVEAINAGLLDLGIDGFQVQKHSDSLYRVVRAGEAGDVFHTLSEGEKMMISFLYFCELCKGRLSADDTEASRIAVIDDPISSLSHVFVFNVGQLIRSVFFRSARISQVFVLTHSLYFFYELTDPNHDRRKQSQKLFRISKSSDGSTIREMKYEEIQNDYQSYWTMVNDPAQPPALIANCMRNIVEYFFNFVRKKDLNNVFLLPELQENKFQAFCRYVNRESHSLGQNLLDLKEFDYDVFKDGLRLVFEKTGYTDHFSAMSKV